VWAGNTAVADLSLVLPHTVLPPVLQVAACCLYIICRQEDKPFMLIDLSDMLQVQFILSCGGGGGIC
jgi:hypothetical protein